MKVMVFDVIDGRMVPVGLEDLPDFTKAPEGVSRQVRRQWERRFRDFRAQYGMPEDLAWYKANVAVFGKRGPV